MNSRRPEPSPAARWVPAVAAGGLLAVVVGVGAMSSGDDGDDAGASTTGVDSTTTVAITAPAPTVTYDAIEESEESTDTVEKVALSQSLSSGFFGDEVQMVQSRLAELGFDPGPVDGQFGGLTTQAVWAFEKLVMGTPRSEATGIVTPEIWDRMQDPLQVVPRRPSGAGVDHVEIYLPEQVMAIFHGGEAVLVTHISTGELAPGATAFTPWQETADEYCETITIDTDDNGDLLEEPIEKAICGRSYTPPGSFTAYRKIEGRRESRLGGMYDPIYINQGIAIHGANEIPLYPASHGCIRVSRYLGEKLQDDFIEIGDEVLIWDGVTEPWNQPASARQMRFDYPDPNATTTTSTTTSTTTTTVEPTTTDVTDTTVASTTTVAPTPATTTTVAPTPATTTTTAPPPTQPPATDPPNTLGGP